MAYFIYSYVPEEQQSRPYLKRVRILRKVGLDVELKAVSE